MTKVKDLSRDWGQDYLDWLLTSVLGMTLANCPAGLQPHPLTPTGPRMYSGGK